MNAPNPPRRKVYKFNYDIALSSDCGGLEAYLLIL